MKISKLSFHFQVIITFRIGWRRSFSSSTFCTQSTISSGQLIGINGYLECQHRCYGRVGSLYFRCTDFSTNEDWTIGTNSFQYTFPIPSISPRYYQVRLVSSDPGPVIRKPINLIQDQCQLFFHSFSFLVKASFAFSCFSKSTSSDVKFCRISALNNTLELRNKLLGQLLIWGYR